MCLQISVDSGEKVYLILCHLTTSLIENNIFKVPNFKLDFCDKSFVKSGSSDLCNSLEQHAS